MFTRQRLTNLPKAAVEQRWNEATQAAAQARSQGDTETADDWQQLADRMWRELDAIKSERNQLIIFLALSFCVVFTVMAMLDGIQNLFR